MLSADKAKNAGKTDKDHHNNWMSIGLLSGNAINSKISYKHFIHNCPSIVESQKEFPTIQ